jgi:hypothetical protein
MLVMAALALGGMLGGSLMATPARAHCDTLDGPVVKDARAALAKGDVTPVLKWLKPANEPEVRDAFRKAMAVRGKGDDARDLADTYFFETLVRVHRAGEGAPYTGLKPAGTEVEPGIAAADAAVESGKADDLSTEVAGAVAAGVRARYAKVAAAKVHANDSVEAGRAFVAAYVDFIHYIEGLHQAAAGPAGHGHEAEAAEHTD